ncbi:2-dehydropantoate 2-reductase [Acetobacter sp. TBRC 12305]|uniref:2-dehydropantoate 2-reductase n=1 Tax=Acetobacter garciniae TaxID=2817435 RepID=A0A939HNM9_9PROT|nr:2-dehydropantoate 2-reductase [Acetobacter garciniae]MBO1325109.1 2-dehydropantoate 2-reductase [Acetobacter garciniae]MBX0344920.1 2-dehydropantoate 2-reductase [Acetobacter garciniae]
MSGGPSVCVAGIGAVGGTVAAMLARAGADVSVVARGATLAALRADGLTLREGGASFTCRPRAAEQASGPARDLVILAVKSHQLGAVLPAVAPVIGPDTLVLPIVNGVPWWMTLPGPDGVKSAYPGAANLSAANPCIANPCAAAGPIVDPGGVLAGGIAPSAILGCVAYVFSTMPQPGVALCARQPRLVLGVAEAGASAGYSTGPAMAAVMDLLRAAGILVEHSADIRSAVWDKVVANLATNPLSVVCEAPLGQLGTDEQTRALIAAVAREGQQVGAACGLHPALAPEHLLDMVAAAGGHDTSMLQDYRGRRPLELAAIGDSVIALARVHGIAVPVTQTLVRLARFKSTADREK